MPPCGEISSPAAAPDIIAYLAAAAARHFLFSRRRRCNELLSEEPPLDLKHCESGVLTDGRRVIPAENEREAAYHYIKDIQSHRHKNTGGSHFAARALI